MSSRQKCPASNHMTLAEARESGVLALWQPRRTRQNQIKGQKQLKGKPTCPNGGRHELKDSERPKLKDGEVRSMGMPFPPSVNNYWCRSADGGMHISKKGREFIDTIAALVGSNRWAGLIGNALCDVALMLTPPNRNVPHDCDNYCKAVLDALTKARVWIDDVQVKSIKVVVMPPNGLGKAEVAVRLHRQHGAVSAAELLGVNV
jgi:crossover junction endodeoxyribonuclease RusA